MQLRKGQLRKGLLCSYTKGQRGGSAELQPRAPLSLLSTGYGCKTRPIWVKLSELTHLVENLVKNRMIRFSSKSDQELAELGWFWSDWFSNQADSDSKPRIGLGIDSALLSQSPQNHERFFDLQLNILFLFTYLFVCCTFMDILCLE